jgi:hypothetical protein
MAMSRMAEFSAVVAELFGGRPVRRSVVTRMTAVIM